MLIVLDMPIKNDKSPQMQTEYDFPPAREIARRLMLLVERYQRLAHESPVLSLTPLSYRQIERGARVAGGTILYFKQMAETGDAPKSFWYNTAERLASYLSARIADLHKNPEAGAKPQSSPDFDALMSLVGTSA